MADAFLGEVRIFSFSRIPPGWAACNGQLLPISQNVSLFALLGTTYGGDGETDFALPDLRGRAPVHVGPSVGAMGTPLGEETHTLTIREMAGHNHSVTASAANANQPRPSILAAVGNAYTSPTNPTALQTATVASTGGSRAHPNMQPSMALNFCISLTGVVPSGS